MRKIVVIVVIVLIRPIILSLRYLTMYSKSNYIVYDGHVWFYDVRSFASV